MSSNFDGFPDGLLPKPKAKTFQFGGDDEPEEEQPSQEPEPEIEARPLAEPPAEPIEQMPAELNLEVDHVELLAASAAVLDDPALKALTEISRERFLTKTPKVAENARVTRGWLDSLDQRHFFLALGYPGHQLLKLLSGETSIGQLRAWVNGLETMPSLLRRILTLEHLLDRRTLANRRRMPTRAQIQAAIRVLPRTAAVSEVLHGFELSAREEERYPLDADSDTVEGVRERLRIVKPGEQAANKGRQGSSLPMSRRLLGEGKPLGYRLLKPNSHCYNISSKSIGPDGIKRLSPQEAMEILNKRADLELQFGVYYSLRRQDTTRPWAADNIEFLPTEQLDEERARHARSRREE